MRRCREGFASTRRCVMCIICFILLLSPRGVVIIYPLSMCQLLHPRVCRSLGQFPCGCYLYGSHNRCFGSLVFICTCLIPILPCKHAFKQITGCLRRTHTDRWFKCLWVDVNHFGFLLLLILNFAIPSM